MPLLLWPVESASLFGEQERQLLRAALAIGLRTIEDDRVEFVPQGFIETLAVLDHDLPCTVTYTHVKYLAAEIGHAAHQRNTPPSTHFPWRRDRADPHHVLVGLLESQTKTCRWG